LAAQRDMEVWLVPVATTRVLVPFRVSVPTPIGAGVMQATQFIAVTPPHAAAATTGPKTQ
jgi:membrane protein DedA with SNARE-associated domain